MADIFSIIEGVLGQITDLKAIETGIYFLSKWGIYLLGPIAVLGIFVLIWIISGIKNG